MSSPTTGRGRGGPPYERGGGDHALNRNDQPSRGRGRGNHNPQGTDDRSAYRTRGGLSNTYVRSALSHQRGRESAAIRGRGNDAAFHGRGIPTTPYGRFTRDTFHEGRRNHYILSRGRGTHDPHRRHGAYRVSLDNEHVRVSSIPEHLRHRVYLPAIEDPKEPQATDSNSSWVSCEARGSLKKSSSESNDGDTPDSTAADQRSHNLISQISSREDDDTLIVMVGRQRPSTSSSSTTTGDEVGPILTPPEDVDNVFSGKDTIHFESSVSNANA